MKATIQFFHPNIALYDYLCVPHAHARLDEARKNIGWVFHIMSYHGPEIECEDCIHAKQLPPVKKPGVYHET